MSIDETLSSCRLSDIAKLNPATEIPSGIQRGSDVSFVPMADVSECGDWFNRQVRKFETVANGFTSFLDGDVLVAKITPCFENGKGAHATTLVNGIGFGSTEFHVLRASADTDGRFLFHVTQSERFRRSGLAFMAGSAGQQRVQRDLFHCFEVPCFTWEEQARVACVLDTLDTAIRQTEAIIAKLKQVKQGLLHDLLTRGIDENGELRPPQSEAPHLYKQSPLGWIPKEWDAVRIGSTLVHPPRNGLYKPPSLIGRGTLIVGQTAFTHDGSVDTALARRARVSIKELDYFGLEPSDLLVTRVYATASGVGLPYLVPSLLESAVYESNMMRLRARSEVIKSEVLFAWLRSAAVRRQIAGAISSSNQSSINQQSLSAIVIGCPDTAEQERIVSVATAFGYKQTHSALHHRQLNDLKTGLMSDLLTGRVRVTPLLASNDATHNK